MSTAAFSPQSSLDRDPPPASALDVEALYAGLRRTVERLVAQRVEAPAAVVEDACQVAWIRLIRHADRVQPAGALGWLVYTARNEACRELRRRRREESLEARIDREPELALLGPDATLSGQLGRRLQLMGLATLPERQQRILWLQAVGLRYAEIAVVTGDTPRTIERQLARGRARLRAAA